jgi:hypothetical protein
MSPDPSIGKELADDLYGKQAVKGDLGVAELCDEAEKVGLLQGRKARQAALDGGRSPTPGLGSLQSPRSRHLLH